MIETLLRRYLESRARVWGVIILTLGLGVAGILPAADNYQEARQRRAELRDLVARIRHDVAGLEQAREKANEKREQLEKLEALTIATDQVPTFRQEIVDGARQAGCQVRRIRVGSPRSRTWHEGDNPLDRTTANPGKTDSPYVLTTHPLTVSVSGALANVESVLSHLQSTDRLIHSESLSLYPTNENRKQVILELELMLFDVTRAEPPSG